MTTNGPTDLPPSVVLPSAPVRAAYSIPEEAQASLRHWLHLWEVPQLQAKSCIELSPRLTRTLGRCYPDRRLVRISAELERAPDGLLQEVLCHEMAHLAVRELHGRKVRPHGPEWKELMTTAGFEPRTRLPSLNEAPRPRKRHRVRTVYVHRCPVCQFVRTARRPMRRWRCAACVDAGLEGGLVLTRYAR